MAATPRRRDEPPFEGGAQPVPDRPQDQPGRGRGPRPHRAAHEAGRLLGLPILWFAGALAGLAQFLSPGAMAALWLGWAVLTAIFLWMLIGMWRRAA